MLGGYHLWVTLRTSYYRYHLSPALGKSENKIEIIEMEKRSKKGKQGLYKQGSLENVMQYTLSELKTMKWELIQPELLSPVNVYPETV